jgi:hypothetical protein
VLDFITPEADRTCHYFWGSSSKLFIIDDAEFDRVRS